LRAAKAWNIEEMSLDSKFIHTDMNKMEAYVENQDAQEHLCGDGFTWNNKII
jgi:hypothetical protein